MVYRWKGKCVICLTNVADSRHIEWNDRKGLICSECNEKTWDCPDCKRYFYTGENKGYKPRHNVAKGKRQKECHGWKSETRRNFEKKYYWYDSSYQIVRL